jgi:hypothetical protein
MAWRFFERDMVPDEPGCEVCDAPVAVKLSGLCVRCCEKFEPPLLHWAAVKRYVFGSGGAG